MAADKRKPKKKAESRPEVESGGPVKDPGPPYLVLWHPEADAERERSWPPKEKAAMLNAVQKLEAGGPRLGSPHSSAVQGETGQGLRELRPRAGRSRWRPIYLTASKFVILAVAPEAQIDSRGFDAAVARAVDRLASLDVD